MNARAARSDLLSVLVPLYCLSLAGCHFRPPPRLSAVVGSVTFERTEMGTGTTSFTGCDSGVYQQFRGADFSGSGFSMRVLRTERKQPVVVLSEDATNKTVELTAATCSVLDVDVFRRWVEIEKLRPGERLRHELDYGGPFVSGSAIFDCATPAGGRVRGSISFRCDLPSSE